MIVCVGISVPEKRAGATDEQGKKKVIYGARQRKSKKKQDEASSSAQSAETAETQDDSSTTKQSEAELEVHELCCEVPSVALCLYIRRMSLIVGMRRGRRKKRDQKTRREGMSKQTGTMKVRKKMRASPPNQLNLINKSNQLRQVIARQR